MPTTAPDAAPQPNALLRYDNIAAMFHWITVALLFTQVGIGFIFHTMERGPVRTEWFTWHKTVGATILLLSLARLAWRLAHKPPRSRRTCRAGKGISRSGITALSTSC